MRREGPTPWKRRRPDGMAAAAAGLPARTAFVPALLLALISLYPLPAAAQAAGPLRVQPLNPRYLTDGVDPVTFLTGWYTMTAFQDYADGSKTNVNFTSYLDSLESFGHNFVRLSVWEDAQYDPVIYQRTGPGTALDGLPKFDCTQFNTSFFTRLRSRVEAASDRGIYVSVCLFQGWSIGTLGHEDFPNPFPYHPFHPSNNINGIDGRDPVLTDTYGIPEGYPVHTLSVSAITSLQKAYIREVVDTLNDLDNVMYEIANESTYNSWSWQYEMINYLRAYQATKPQQHLVGMSAPGGPYSQTGQGWLKPGLLFGSPADWVAPPYDKAYGDYYDFRDLTSWPASPLAAGGKVILLDSDHVKPGEGNLFEGSIDWVWKSFTRGMSPFSLDIFYNPGDTSLDTVFNALGCTRELAGEVDFVSLTPSKTITSTGFCLFRPGTSDAEYIVYLPDGGSVTVDLSDSSGPMSVEWIDPETCARTAGSPITAGSSSQVLTSPLSGEAALYLASAPSPPVVATPEISPNGGSFAGTVTVTLSCTTASSTIRYTTDGGEPTGASTAYASPLILTSGTTVKAKGFRSGYADSATTEATFTEWDEPVAIELDGLGRFFDMPTLTNVTATSGFSVELWIYPHTRFDWNNIIGATGGWNQYLMHTTALGGMYAGTTESTRFTPSQLGSNTLELNTWQHFVFTFDGSSQQAKFYKNGSPLSTKTMGAPLQWSGFRIGAAGPAGVDGFVDEARIYDRPLSSTEVTTHYGAGAGAYGQPESGLVGGWHFDEGTGNIAHDYSGNGRDALLMYGGVWTDGKVVSGASAPTPADAPDIDPNGGTHATSVEVTLSAAGDGALIVYTTDGSVPGMTSPQYAGPFTLTESATVKARTYRDGYDPSSVSQAAFVISSGTIGIDGLTLE